MAAGEAAILKEEQKDFRYVDITLPRDELSRNLGGGIPKNSILLIEGQDGAGKSILAQRFTYSLLINNLSATYISSELNTISFIDQMESLDYDVKHYLLNEDLLFIPMFPLLGNTTLNQNFMSKLLKTEELFKNEVIIFDTLSFLMIKNKISENECFDLINVLKKFASLGKTIVFNVDPAHLNATFLTLLRSVSDIYFKLNIKDFAGMTVRQISIPRFKRPQTNYQVNIPFKVESGKGLRIEIASFD